MTGTASGRWQAWQATVAWASWAVASLCRAWQSRQSPLGLAAVVVGRCPRMTGQTAFLGMGCLFIGLGVDQRHGRNLAGLFGKVAFLADKGGFLGLLGLVTLEARGAVLRGRGQTLLFLVADAALLLGRNRGPETFRPVLALAEDIVGIVAEYAIFIDLGVHPAFFAVGAVSQILHDLVVAHEASVRLKAVHGGLCHFGRIRMRVLVRHAVVTFQTAHLTMGRNMVFNRIDKPIGRGIP